MTVNERWQSSDDCYLTAEEPLEEQTVKTKKEKKTSKLLSSIMTQEPLSHSREGD